MKNVKLLVPQGEAFDNLPEQVKAGINKVFGQFVNPMPGTIAFEGFQVVDAVTDDSFDPALMPAYGIDWDILFIGRWDGVENTDWDEIIVPLDKAEFMKYLPEPEEGEKVFVMPHKFMGWPDIT